MKNILKRIFVSLIVLLLSISNFNSTEIVNAITTFKKNTIIEIFEIKNDSEVVISDNIIDLYNKDPNNEDFEEYKHKQARLEMENYRLEKAKQERTAYKTKIVNFSKQFVGNPYVMGGTSLTNGADCSGFVQTVYANFGIKLPRTTVEQAVVGIEVSQEDIEIGDIVSYGYDGFATHSAIYIGDDKILHAATEEMGIRIDNMYILPILTIRRVV